mgnify:CR=1 FL=1
MYENEFRVVILLIGILVIFYILFISKDKRKYKVYKTKNYDIKSTINIVTNKKVVTKKNIDISLGIKQIPNNARNVIKISASKPRQMPLVLGRNHEKKLIIISSVAKNNYKIQDIHEFMEKKGFIMNSGGFYDKFHTEKHINYLKYSVTNIINPGYLDESRLKDARIKGICFFMQLPANTDPLNIFNEMISDARIFTNKNKGILYNSNKIILNNKLIKDLKSTVMSYRDEH